MNTKRLDWIDIAKGIGIILVVLGHTLVPQHKGFVPSWHPRQT